MPEFADIPAEIRNKIYDLVLVAPSSPDIVVNTKPHAGLLALTQVSRSVRREAISSYYGSKTVRIQTTTCELKALKKWLDAIGPQAVKAIRRLSLEGYFRRTPRSIHKIRRETLSIDFRNTDSPLRYTSSATKQVPANLTPLQWHRLQSVVSAMDKLELGADGLPEVTAAVLLKMFDAWSWDAWVVRYRRR